MIRSAPPASLADRVLAGDPRAVARAISVIEDENADSAAIVRAIFAHTGRAQLIGVTGPPGAGKSTLVDRLAAEYRRAGLTVGIIAVDPTSPFSGGAVLGDRLRMQSHTGDPGVFIRSMATRGQLGGLARATADAALVLDAVRQGCRRHRDGWRRAGRSGYRPHRRRLRRHARAGRRRRGAGAQSRHHGDRRHLRGEQGRSRRERSASCRRSRPVCRCARLLPASGGRRS